MGGREARKIAVLTSPFKSVERGTQALASILALNKGIAAS